MRGTSNEWRKQLVLLLASHNGTAYADHPATHTAPKRRALPPEAFELREPLFRYSKREDVQHDGGPQAGGRRRLPVAIVPYANANHHSEAEPVPNRPSSLHHRSAGHRACPHVLLRRTK